MQKGGITINSNSAILYSKYWDRGMSLIEVYLVFLSRKLRIEHSHLISDKYKNVSEWKEEYLQKKKDTLLRVHDFANICKLFELEAPSLEYLENTLKDIKSCKKIYCSLKSKKRECEFPISMNEVIRNCLAPSL